MVPPLLPPKKTTRNFNSFRQGCATREHSQAENDQRNGFPVRPRRRKLADTYPPLTNVYFRWPRLSSPSFPLFPCFSRSSTPLSFFLSSQGGKTSARTLDPSREPNWVPGAPVHPIIAPYNSVHLYETWWNETWWMMEDHGSRWWRDLAKGRERLIAFY